LGCAGRLGHRFEAVSFRQEQAENLRGDGCILASPCLGSASERVVEPKKQACWGGYYLPTPPPWTESAREEAGFVLKLECDKLASEKSEMQRHYVMYYEMSYGLNIEMHKQAEIVKRLNGICAQVLPYLSQEHQQQVLGAIERAKQVTAPELNSIIR
ncbi:PREDICTED: amino-terminal enhancer of split, partial [Eurypyga helias]|uniref:amino-terminal enhancer of split n=1 Tax=Eurypyga helias TaxID=54383 RepID=UPI0005285DB6